MAPISNSAPLEFVSRSSAQTERIGFRLAQLAQPGDVFCLSGELGAGKTCLARGMGAGLGVREPVTSPTFVMINEHRIPESPLRLYHIDLYRITSPEEAWTLGLDEYLHDEGICVIEWPERARSILPDHLWVNMEYVDEDQRGISIRAVGARYERLLYELAKGDLGMDEA
jgi:tRNA threonylcarbamoyladenosine biosynthesis protein TsaE